MGAETEVAYSDLAWALRAVLPHAGRDTTLPALAGVRLEAPGDGWLYLAATDRYTLGVARVKITSGESATAAATIGRLDAEEIGRRIKGRGLDRDGGCAGLYFYPDGEVAFDLRVRYEAVPGEFPAWRDVLGRALRATAGAPGAAYGYNPAYLGRFVTARRTGSALAVMPVRLKTRSRVYPDTVAGPVPMTVVLGDSFAGVVMSARMVTGAKPRTPAILRAWRDAVPDPLPDVAP